MNERQILVVASDFALVEQVRTAMRSRGFRINGAFSHRDAAHTLKMGQYVAAIVDHAMFDRHSGEQTLLALAHLSLRPPLIVVMLDGDVEMASKLPPNTAVGLVSTDAQSIQRAVIEALRLPIGAAVEARSSDDTPIGTIVDANKSLEEIRTLFALGRSLTEVLDLSEVLNRVVESARRLTDAEQGMILLPDPETGELYLRARVGIESEVARNFRIKTRDTLAGTVFSTGQPVIVGARGPQKVKTEFFVNSLLYVPILLKGKQIGVLGVSNQSKHDVFDAHHQELLLNLASYAAVAIENARIHEESLKQARELKALVDASRVINSTLELDRTLPNICEQLVQGLNVNRSDIFEWDQEKNCLRRIASFHRATWRPGHEPVISLAQQPLLAGIVQRRTYELIKRNGTSDESEIDDLYREGADGVLIQPIYFDERCIGVVRAFYLHATNRVFSAETYQRVQNLILEQFAAPSSSIKDNTINLVKLSNGIRIMFNADWCEIALYDSAAQAFVVAAMAGRGVWLAPPYPSIDLCDYPDLVEAMNAVTPINQQVDSSSLLPGARFLLNMTRSRSVLAVPLVNRGQAQGLVLFSDTQHTNAFSAREVDMARAMVGQAATALENAGLVADLEASLRELKETQGRLIQTARLSAMGELAAAVAHQINNPLTTIMVDSELMLLDEPPDSARYKTLETIMRAGKRAASVVRRLLAAARPSDPQSQLAPVNVVATIEDVIALVRGHIERDHVRLIVQLPDELLPPVLAVPSELDDVWLNLLLNAHDALRGRPDPELGIAVSYVPTAAILDVQVWDNGQGIPEEVVNDIFKPFFTTKPPGEGTGLGLHICRQAVEHAGGTISVESVPGEGTSFLVRLPVIREVES